MLRPLRSAESSWLRRNRPQVNVSGQLPPGRTMPHADAEQPPARGRGIIAPNIRGSREGRLMQGSHDIGGSAMGVGIGQVRLDSKVG